MENSHDDGNYWGTLINPDKSPSPLLEQLCMGLAQLLVKLDNGNGSVDLTPDKLARFYREVGANYDTLFLDTKGPALSFIYQSLGCFHTLQPTTNPFEPPSIPALLPTGFVRWQVINLLLYPDEHAQYLQTALSIWDVPNPSGGIFPKVIPRDAFPEAPDQDMVQWHEAVSQKLEKEHADQHSSSRRHIPAEFVRYYSAATDERDHRYPEEGQHFSKNDSTHRANEGVPRSSFDDKHEDSRYHNRRYFSPDGRPRRRRIFEEDEDGRADSRASSRNLSPRQTASPASKARVPLRSKTMRVRNRESPEQRPSYARHRHQAHQQVSSSDSSNNDDGLFRRRRYGSTDDHRHERSAYLSPTRGAGLPRRHSHDATSPSSKSREQQSDASHVYKADRNSPRPRRYMAAPRAKFQENQFDEPARANQPSTLYTDVPRVHVKHEGSPSEYRPVGRPGSGNSGASSGSDRPRSSSNGSGEAGWKGWKGWSSASRAARRVSAHE